MEKADEFVKWFTGSDVAEITATARNLWSDVLQTPKALLTCVAIALSAMGAAGFLLGEYFCDCNLP